MEQHTPLSDELIKKTFEEKIKPKFLSHLKSVDRPKSVFLAGQPGAGKTNLGDLSKLELNGNVLLVDIDKIREYHPNKKEAKDPYTLDVDTRKWKSMLVDECIKNKYNVIFDGTLGGKMQYIEPDMQKMKDAGYVVKINALSVNDSISKLGFISRYEEGLKVTKNARNVDLSFHNDIYKNIPNNLTEAIGKGLITEMNIYKRNHELGKTELLNSYNASIFKSNKDIPIYDFDKERVRPLLDNEIKELKSWYKDTISTALSNNSDILKIHETIKTDDPKASLELKNQLGLMTNINIKELIVNHELKKGVAENDLNLIRQSIKNGADIKTLNKSDFKHLNPIQEKTLLVEMQKALNEKPEMKEGIYKRKGLGI